MVISMQSMGKNKNKTTSRLKITSDFRVCVIQMRSTHLKFHSGLKACGLATPRVAKTFQQMVFCKVHMDVAQPYALLSSDA